MKKLFFLLSVVVMTLASCTQQPKPEKYLYLCIGQSNMVGKGIIEPQDTIVPERFLNLASTDQDDRKIGEWRLAKPGNCRPSANYPNHVSPTDYFGRTLLEYLPENVTVGIIQVGVDGCPMRLFDKDAHFCDSIQADWMEGQINGYDRKPWERLVTLAHQAINEGWQIKGLLIHQGETDAYSSAWPNQVNKIYNDLQQELGFTAADCPILAGEAVGADQNGVCAHANPTIDHIHDYIPTAYAISAYACQVSPDNLHFSAEGYRRLGKRYAIKWLQLNGYDVADDADSKLQVEMGDATDAFEVSAYIRKPSGELMVASSVPVASVDLVSYSGETLCNVPFDGATVKDIDISAYATEDRIVLNIHSMDGQTVNRQVNR